MIREILEMVTEGSSVSEVAESFSISKEEVLSRLETMERMGWLSTKEDVSGPDQGHHPSGCGSCMGCGCKAQGRSCRQYRLTEKGRRVSGKQL